MEKLQKESSAALLREAPSLHGISKMFNISCYRLGGDPAIFCATWRLLVLGKRLGGVVAEGTGADDRGG
jgi:hypothetical protein